MAVREKSRETEQAKAIGFGVADAENAEKASLGGIRSDEADVNAAVGAEVEGAPVKLIRIYQDYQNLINIYQNFNQILAKLAPPIAREGAFFSVFRDLHDFRIFPRKI